RQMLAEVAAISRGQIVLLRQAGITPAGFGATGEVPALDRLTTEADLRDAFRAVFGDVLADDLGSLLSRQPSTYPAAVVVGNSVVVPNLPDRNHLGIVSNEVTKPLVVTRAGYLARVETELSELDANRRAFLDAAAIEHHETGSVAGFVSSVRSFGQDDGVST